jgi:16S rRNA (cytidine1402-2'-O)-methyltransferase
MLYLVATPIGNLGDITLRALEVLRGSDYILCEDTRRSRVLLTHFGIQKPLKSYHLFNELEGIYLILKDLKEGRQLALVSDAGTPGIADPGMLLVERCREASIPVTVIPGPSAAIGAITLSGFSTKRFQFLGFLPKKRGERKTLLIELIHFPGTSICYESPHRLLETLQLIASFGRKPRLASVRELTKIHEECLIGTAEELIAHFQSTQPLGECVLLIEGEPYLCEEFPLKEEVEELQKVFDISLNEAIKMVASLRGLPKRALYQKIHISN